MSAQVNVDVQVAAETPSVPAEADIRWWLSKTVAAVCQDSSASFEVAVRIVDEHEGRELNKQYANKDKATNVLSFPAGDPVTAQLLDGDTRLLGDVVICGPVVEREAADQGKDPASHWGHLLVHGALHLLGYDHQTARQAAEMEALERDLLAQRGIADPYAAA